LKFRRDRREAVFLFMLFELSNAYKRRVRLRVHRLET
jgi:hypothetical protein